MWFNVVFVWFLTWSQCCILTLLHTASIYLFYILFYSLFFLLHHRKYVEAYFLSVHGIFTTIIASFLLTIHHTWIIYSSTHFSKDGCCRNKTSKKRRVKSMNLFYALRHEKTRDAFSIENFFDFNFFKVEMSTKVKIIEWRCDVAAYDAAYAVYKYVCSR